MRRESNLQENRTSDRGLTRKQAAAMTGYAEKTLANLALLGEGPPMRKHRGHCLYLESEVLEWLKSLPVSGGRTA
jgi:predicted DNA-binding transcriptional regulator AlpA